MLRLSSVLVCLATPVLSQDAGEGAALFATDCAMCHGADATGGGQRRSMATRVEISMRGTRPGAACMMISLSA